VTERHLPAERGVVDASQSGGGGASTPSFALPDDATPGVPGAPRPLTIGPARFDWGRRTYVMGVLNITPDSFSGDGLLASGDPVAAAVTLGSRMVAEGADLLDIGGASSRPGHADIAAADETARVVPVIRAVTAALPDTVVSVDTTSPAVAAAALDAGVPWDHVVVDPGFGFGKTPDHNLALMAHLAALRVLGRPILLGTSRKSTLGRLLDLPAGERVEATVATTALGIAAGIDIVRVHDVRENVRAARTADAIHRGWRPAGWEVRP
jgi:dihydropteroate synthase